MTQRATNAEDVSSVNDIKGVEQELSKADDTWLSGDAATAVPRYESLLSDLPSEAEPFRATIIMRLARARLTSGDKAGCLAALERLAQMEYVPEHHALAARELEAVVAGKPHPGQTRTPVPAIGSVRATLVVDSSANLDGEGTPSKPFATLEAAVEAARVLRKHADKGAIEIVLEPGIYRRSQTLKLTVADAGTADSPVVIRSRDPSRPATLTGGTVLRSWTAVKDPWELSQLPETARDAVRACDLSANGVEEVGELVFGGFGSKRAIPKGNHRFATLPVPELFHKGEPQTMARWPNDGMTRIPVDEVPETETQRYRRWAKERDLWLHGYWWREWSDAYEKVASIEPSGLIRLVPPTSGLFTMRQGRAVNALCELDRPGEWYLDVERNRVLLWPPEGFDPEQCILSTFGTAIHAQACPYLQVRDLSVNFVRGDALIFDDCSDLLLAGIDIQDCSGLGIRIHGGKQHLVHSCRVDSMGRGGIDLWAGDWQQLAPAHSTIENCRISNLSRIDRTYTPAVLLEGMGLKVRHNSFIDIPSSAIRLEACDALIELNHFRRCVYESGDQGAIDMWGNPLYRGNIIRWNDFDRIIASDKHRGAAAVRHDDFISGFMVTENTIRKGSGWGAFGAIQFNQGTDNYAEGNVIVGWHKVFSGGSGVGEHWTSRITTHSNSKRMLAETDWKSEAWRKKYPMVRDLLNGNDNHNYLIGNLLLGAGDWGSVGRAMNLGNRTGSKDTHGATLAELKPHLVPWYPIPVELIGPYAAVDRANAEANVVAPGWERSHQAGKNDPNGYYMGGGAIIHLVAHQGLLFAANSYWCDSRNPWYGGTDLNTGWGQILRLDCPGGPWVVDLEMGPSHLRPEILKSVTFQTNGTGQKLKQPVSLLLTSTFMPLSDRVEISLFTRDDAAGKWNRSVVYSCKKPKNLNDCGVRAIRVHRDKVTGVDRLFLSIGKFGIFSGVYDEKADGKVKWSSESESGPVETRPLAIIEANGDLLFSAGRRIYRRIDGTAPSYQVIHDVSDLYTSEANHAAGGIRGLTAIANPKGRGESLLFAMSESGGSRGEVYRLDPKADGTFTRTREVAIADLMSQYLDGNPVLSVCAAYNCFFPVIDPATGKAVHLFGFASRIGGHKFPTWGGNEDGGFYAGSVVGIRDEQGRYRLKEVNGRSTTSKPILVGTRCFAISPFPADAGRVIYFGGHDQSYRPSSNMAWIFSTRLDDFLRSDSHKK